jgi:hypothetical protein
VRVSGRTGDKPSTFPVSFDDGPVEITLPDLHLLVLPAADANEFVLCR